MSTTTLTDLIAESGVDEEAVAAMQLTIDTLGPDIQAGLGDVALDDIATSEVVLITLLLDDSSSIRFGGNTQHIRDGHNLVLEALRASKQSAAVLVSCSLLNGGVLYPYVLLENAPKLDASNYDPNGGTPLFEQSAVVLTTVAAKMSEFEQGGIAARAVTVIVTDGGDTGGRQTVGDVRRMVTGMLVTEQHIIAGIGVDDGYTNFRQVFGDMGILDEWILTPGNSASEIRRTFQVVSQSAVRASQTAGSFSQAAMGGFGA
ncbi:MAG: hypothetical protein WAQ27_01925 [Candidatus Microsaccharimonas sp.]